MTNQQKVVVVGAGPVGSLAALYAAKRGNQVEVYELRPDLRCPDIVPLNFTKSINLALSQRGICAIKEADHPGLLESIMAEATPLKGRMIHGRTPTGVLCEQAQDYDVNGRTIFAIDRAGLNGRLLDALDSMPNVKLCFGHKFTRADFSTRQAWMEKRDQANGKHSDEIQIDFDVLIGADGAHSTVRHHMMKFSLMDYQQEYIDTIWCEFQLSPRETLSEDPWAKFRISPNHLHIWPGNDFMFIAIPCKDGSFTCTLFMPKEEYVYLEEDPSKVPNFFDSRFPGVTDLISAESLVHSFANNPHLPLISIKCKPYHYGSSAIIIGDAAHAMVPFYGQGMNAGLEDVLILFGILDKCSREQSCKHLEECVASLSSATCRPQMEHALAEYSALRVQDAHAINDLALENYVEMRLSVLSRRRRLRKYFEEFMSVQFPKFGWQTRYSRVSFSTERYSEILIKSEQQGKMLMRSLLLLATSMVALSGVVAIYIRPLLGLLLRGLAY